MVLSGAYLHHYDLRPLTEQSASCCQVTGQAEISREGAAQDHQPFKVNVRLRSTAVITAAA